MKMLTHLTDPVYVCRPSQIIRRIKRALATVDGRHMWVRLPWGGQLKIIHSEKIGRTILHRGVHDLDVTEACFRLADIGTTVIDAGANVGQMTSALAYAVGKTGSVIAFEPHPTLFSLLSENVSQMESELGGAFVTARQEAVSNQSGETELFEPSKHGANSGLATMTQEAADDDTFVVEATRLDDLEIKENVQLLKMDIEGHERAACEGAERLLSNRQIKNVIFEDFDIQCSDVAHFLEDAGYTILAMRGSVRGPYLANVGSRGDAYNFVATTDVEACKDRYASNGWHCLRSTS